MSKIIFWSNNTYFDGDYLERKGLGGSESALINLTRNIKELYPNTEIIVYNGWRRQTEYYGIIYKSAIDFYSDCKYFDADVFISLREVHPFTLPYIDAKLKILWSQDDENQKELQELRRMPYIKENIDSFLAISEYAKGSIQRMFPDKTVYLQRNGYNQDLTKDLLFPRNPIGIYTSTPYRGLDVLAGIWPKIYDKCISRGVTPELWVFGDMTLYGWDNKDFEGLFSYLRTLPNVKVYGSVCQKDLYEYLKQSKVMLYPNHFLETGAMSVLEAIACGNWIVTTDLGALNEQVKDNINGYTIRGDSRSIDYQKQFIEKSVELLLEKNLPRNNVEDLIFSWGQQADNLLKIIRSFYDEKTYSNFSRL